MRLRLTHLTTTLRALCMMTTLTVATTAYAQNSGSEALQVTAKVIQPLFMAVTQPLLFGSVFVGGSKTVSTHDDAAGHVEVRGETNALLNVTLTMPTTLRMGSTSNVINTSNWSYTTSGQASPTNFTAGSTVPFTVTLPNNGSPARLTILVGATITADANQAIGDYSASGQITIAYADI